MHSSSYTLRASHDPGGPTLVVDVAATDGAALVELAKADVARL